jgi:hypothetical protein
MGTVHLLIQIIDNNCVFRCSTRARGSLYMSGEHNTVGLDFLLWRCFRCFSFAVLLLMFFERSLWATLSRS